MEWCYRIIGFPFGELGNEQEKDIFVSFLENNVALADDKLLACNIEKRELSDVCMLIFDHASTSVSSA